MTGADLCRPSAPGLPGAGAAPVPETRRAASLPAAVPGALGPPPRLRPGWPHADRSHGVAAGGLHWHVQWWEPPADPASRTRPTLLLLHGTGASAHSWRDLAPRWARHARVVVPDLPGHGATSRPDRAAGLSLPGMAGSVGALVQALGLTVDVVVGHSAGAAIGARACLDGGLQPHSLVSLNGAWFPPQGVAGWWYPPLARLMAANPLSPWLLSWQASQPAALKRLVEGTGSTLDATGLALYRQLAADTGHVGSVITMMSQWDLQPLLRDLPRLRPALWQWVGDQDRAVPPDLAFRLQQRLPASRVRVLPGLGHLAHEESPRAVADLVRAAWDPASASAARDRAPASDPD